MHGWTRGGGLERENGKCLVPIMVRLMPASSILVPILLRMLRIRNAACMRITRSRPKPHGTRKILSLLYFKKVINIASGKVQERHFSLGVQMQLKLKQVWRPDSVQIIQMNHSDEAEDENYRRSCPRTPHPLPQRAQ